MTEAINRPTLPVSAQMRIHADYFFDFHDQQFIEEVYRKLLFREPDLGGLEAFVAIIRRGESRYKVLYAVSQSPEAREKGVAVDGMDRYQVTEFLERIPFIGSLLEIFSFLWHIKSFRRDMRALENHIYRISQYKQQE